MSFDRRDFLRTAGLAAAATAFPMNWAAGKFGANKKILMFTRSQGFQHDVVNRSKPDGKKFLGEKGKLAHAEFLVTEWGKKHGFDVTCTKDGRVFIPEELDKYDAFFFYTTGDLTEDKAVDGSAPMSKEGKKYFLDAIAKGKGFLGTHCATDTFHSKGPSTANQPASERDPYIQMIGGEFIVHGEQFAATMKVVSELPGTKGLSDFDLKEEWYALKNFSPDLHVILAQDSTNATAAWKKDQNPNRVKGGNAAYFRPLYPATWARKHHDGRVFYTSMGHREDVWTNETFQKVLLGGIAWALGNVDADIPSNIAKVTPDASVLKE